MKKLKTTQVIALALAFSMTVGCSGNNTKSVRTGSSAKPAPSIDSSVEIDNKQRSTLETVVVNTATVLRSGGDGIIDIGGTVSQIGLPLADGITGGSGEVITNLGEGVNSLSKGLSDGLGAIGSNNNAIGTTLAGVTGTVSETGQAVTALKSTFEGVGDLPVFAQLDGATGLLTDLGASANVLGGVVTQAGNRLTYSLANTDNTIGGLTTDLTAVIRPLFTSIDGKTQAVGDALVVGSLASSLLEKTGTAVVVLGNNLSKSAVLAGTGGTVEGVGQLVISAGGILTLGNADSDNRFDLASLPGGDALGGLTGGDSGLVGSVTDTLGGLTGGDSGLVGSVTGTLGGLVGGLSP